MSNAVALGGVIVALAAIAGATVAVSTGHLGGDAYSAIIGALVGVGSGTAGAHYVNSNGAKA
jgi:hypothetical protein